MPVNHTDVVARVKAELSSRGVNLQGPCGAFQITMRVAWELRGEGAGLIAKFGPQNGCEWPAGSGNKYGVDIVMYPDGTLFDILISAETENQPAWQVPSGGAMVAPALYRPAINPNPGPDPDPNPALHRYDGGGNDTDICDRCGKPRLDPVHAISESKVRHDYDGGEHDTGTCDICGRGPDDPLHRKDAPLSDLSETNRLLGEILESAQRQERALASLIDVIRARG